MPPTLIAFSGARSGQFVDPWGHRWDVQTHVEDVSAEELVRRAAALFPPE